MDALAAAACSQGGRILEVENRGVVVISFPAVVFFFGAVSCCCLYDIYIYIVIYNNI